MFQFYADKNKLAVRQKEPVTSGSVNAYQVRFSFSQDWDGLTRTAVFKGGGETRSVLLDGSNECTIPWETLQQPLGLLEAGVYGTSGGSIVLPTVWVSLGIILPGAVPDEGTQPPTPDAYQQMLEQTQKVQEEIVHSRAEITQAAQQAQAAVQSAEQAIQQAQAAQEASESAASASTAAREAAKLAADQAADSAAESAVSADSALSAAGEAEQSAAAARLEAERAAALTGKMPIIRDGMWWTYDPEGGAYASTGQPAQGEKGDPGEAGAVSDACGPSAEASVETAIPGTPLQPASEIRPAQAGAGTPSPENIREITGWDGVTLTRNGQAFSRSFPETVYVGTFNWATGELTVTHKYFALAVDAMNRPDEFCGWNGIAGLEECYPEGFNKILDVNSGNVFCNIHAKIQVYRIGGNVRNLFLSAFPLSQSELKARYPGLVCQFVLPLLEPRTIQLTPEEITALPGVNTLTSDCGGTAVTFSSDVKRYIDRRISELLERGPA